MVGLIVVGIVVVGWAIYFLIKKIISSGWFKKKSKDNIKDEIKQLNEGDKESIKDVV